MTTPAWFRRALDVPRAEHSVRVAGASISFVAWGDPGHRDVLLVHGAGGNAHWWTSVAAHLACDRRVVALDLSGHGDSDHRSTYTLDLWAEEVAAVIDAARFDAPPVVVGHSVGGMVTAATAAHHGDLLAAIVLCDSPITARGLEADHQQQLPDRARPAPTYATVEEAVRRFRVIPPGPEDLDFLVAHVAEQSLRPGEGGWQIKTDRAMFDQTVGLSATVRAYLPEIRCPVAMLPTEHGLVTAEILEEVCGALPRPPLVAEVPAAGHHVMLDQPLALVMALRVLLVAWPAEERPDSAGG